MNQCRELRHQIEEAVKLGWLAHLVKEVKKGKAKVLNTQLGEWKKGDKGTTPTEAPILMISKRNNTPKRKSTKESTRGLGKIMFPLFRETTILLIYVLNYRSNQYKDAKTLFAAIQTRFGGNEATKKTQKTLLKQMYENFSATSTESLDCIFNRLQKIVSQLAILDESISQEDLNLKFLRSLPSKWNTHVVIWRNKPDLDTMSFDDLYNNFKILALLSMRTRRFFQKTGRKITINGSDIAGYDKSKVECFNCDRMGHFVREYRGPRNQDSRNRNQDSSRRTVNVEETSSKAMVAIDGADISYKDSEISMLKSELEKLKQEKESNQLKIENFDNASKSLDKLIGSRITDKSRKGLGFVSYNAVPPPHTGLFLPPDLDLSYSTLEEFQQPEFEGYGPKTTKSVSEDISNEVRQSLDASLVEELVSDDKLEKKTIFPTADCNYHQRERVVSRNNLTRVNYNYSARKAHPSAYKNIVPIAVLMKTGLRPLNTARPINTAYPKTKVYSDRPMSHFSKSAQSIGHPQKEDQGYVDGGCSRHMTRNMSYLLDFKEFDRRYVTFRGGSKRGKITGFQVTPKVLHLHVVKRIFRYLKGTLLTKALDVSRFQSLDCSVLECLSLRLQKINTHVVVWRNKPNLDIISFDDLYNNFKTVEQKVKGTASSRLKLKFLELGTASTQVSTANLSDDTVYAFLASQPNGSQLVHEDLEQIHEDDLEEIDLKWQLALLSMRTRKRPGNQDNRSRNQDSSRRTINVEEISSKVMLAIDGAGLDWSFMADEKVLINMALMDFLDSKFNKFEFNLATYKSGLASVEEQLVFYKKNEVLFCKELAVLKRDISYKDSEISVLKKEFQQPEFEGYRSKTSKSVSEGTSNEVRESPDASLVEELVSKWGYKIVIENSIFPTVAKINFVKSQQQEKPVRKLVTYAKMYMSQTPRGNQRNWNNQKCQQLGSDFVMYNKACFVCGSFKPLWQANAITIKGIGCIWEYHTRVNLLIIANKAP
ncbi:hypothetical protein Tco_1553937 [Tanacetum coccineum]